MSKSKLRIVAPDDGTRIEVLDPTLQPIALSQNARMTEVDVDPGTYAVRFRRGLAVTEKLAQVPDNNTVVTVVLDQDEEPYVVSAAPIIQLGEQFRSTHTAAERISRNEPLRLSAEAGARGDILLFLWSDQPYASRLSEGLTLLHDDGRVAASIDQVAEADAGWSGVRLSVPVGAYRLRRAIGSGSLEQVLHVREKWQTQFFGKGVVDEESGLVDLILQSVMMRSSSVGFSSESPAVRYAESGLRALRERAAVPGSANQETTENTFDSPLLNVISILLQLRNPDANIEELKSHIERLVVVTDSIPDVLALGLALMTRNPELQNDDRMRHMFTSKDRLSVPPYFSESWRHIVAASVWMPEIIPIDSLASHASMTIARAQPWFRWRSNDLRGTPTLSRAEIGRFGLLPGLVRSAFSKSTSPSDGIDDPYTATLSEILKSVQGAFEKFDVVTELLSSNALDDVHHRVAGFVYPFMDPVLAMLADVSLEGGRSLRESALLRGRDGRELSRVLQLPVGAAVISCVSLYARLEECLSEAKPSERVASFVARESRGSERLAGVLRSLEKIPTSIRQIGISRPLDSLSYFVLRYESTLSHHVQRLSFVDKGTGEPVDPSIDRRILNGARNHLRRGILSAQVEGSIWRLGAGGVPLVATLRDFKPGELFSPASLTQTSNLRKAARLVIRGLSRLQVRTLQSRLGEHLHVLPSATSRAVFAEPTAPTVSVDVSRESVDTVVEVLSVTLERDRAIVKIQRGEGDSAGVYEVTTGAQSRGLSKEEMATQLIDSLSLDLTK